MINREYLGCLNPLFDAYVCATVDDDTIILREVYPTTEQGYRDFITWAHAAEEEYGYGVSIEVEATGNSRYFRNAMERE